MPTEFKGGVLRVPAVIQQRMGVEFRKLITQMTRETKRDLEALFKSPEADVFERIMEEVADTPAMVMDASIGDMAARLIERLQSKFMLLFESASTRIVGQMIASTFTASTRTLDSSLKETSKRVTIRPNEATAQLIDAAAQEAAALIKRVPADYLPQVQGDVMRSITSGNGLQDLVPALEKRNVKIKNWATNVARDQTRKAYATMNRVRMQGVGVKKFEWIHSGGSNQPREYHMHRWPSGLNGGIFSFDDPPIIDERTGQRGFPGDLPYCGCTMRPIIDVEEL